MPLARAVLLAPNFTAGELGADDPTADNRILANLQRVASWLQVGRGVLAVPLRVTSGYRSPERNVQIGGSETSDHPNGLAADFVPVGISQFDAYQSLNAAAKDGRLPAWDQIIYYPVQGHIHVGLGARMRREVRIALKEGGMPLLSADLADQLRGFV